MAAVIKEIIAAFKTTGVSQFQGAAKQAEGAVSGIHNAASKATNAIGNLMRNGAQLSGITALLSGVGAGMLAKGAIDATANYERMTATLTALTGSAQRAKGTMSWLEGFGATSVFEQMPLQEATTRLEAFGMTASKWLPTISNLAATFGTDGTYLMELADALGRLKAGQSGEALEALRRFGIGNDLLMNKGITFDGGGQMTSDVVTALNAIEKIIKEKAGNISEIMGGTLAVKMSNLGDSWQRILRLTGDVFSPALKTLIDGLGETMNRLATSGVVTQIAQGFASLLNSDKMINGFRTGVSWLLAGFDALPSILKGFWEFGQDLKHAFVFLLNKLADTQLWSYFGQLVSKSISESLPKVMSGVFRSLNVLLAEFEIGLLGPILGKRLNGDDPWIIKQLKGARDASMKGLSDSFFIQNPMNTNTSAFSNVLATYANLGNVFTNMGGKQQSFLAMMMSGSGAAATSNPADPQKPVGLLGQIASNTSKTAENTQKQIQDLRKFVVGGGSLGDAGVTPVAMFGSRRGMGFTINQGRIHSAAEEFVRYVAQDVMQQLMKLGSRWASG